MGKDKQLKGTIKTQEKKDKLLKKAAEYRMDPEKLKDLSVSDLQDVLERWRKKEKNRRLDAIIKEASIV